jgi:hypothetical protein
VTVKDQTDMASALRGLGREQSSNNNVGQHLLAGGGRE